jgi:hypothetical protein
MQRHASVLTLALPRILPTDQMSLFYKAVMIVAQALRL